LIGRRCYVEKAGNGSNLVKVTWDIRRKTDEDLAVESGALGVAKATLARLLLDWAVQELRSGRVKILSRSGTAASESNPEDSETELLVERE
jgi:hypothetical protein